jgi:tetratricopeptide (TPR) repeat protein
LIPGTRIGRFVVTGVLGSGGMGVVLRADDLELGRTVALKLLVDPFAADSGELRARQLAEARALARLSHPNVVEVYDVGVFDHHVYLAMELAEGSTLRAWLRDAAPSIEERLHVLAQLGAGLAAVHAAGLVHRDFKPDNAIIGADGRARIVDFGLARDETAAFAVTPRSGMSSSDITPLTQTGQVMGTPAYMPPEQLRGQPVDALADQFAFCVTAFEALHGRRPFGGQSTSELLIALERGTVRHDRRRRVPRRVDGVLLRGLQADRTRRFASMHDLLAALRAAQRPSRARWIGASGLAVTAAALAAATHRSAPSACAATLASDSDTWPRRRADVQAAFERSGLPDATARWQGLAERLDRYAAALGSNAARACELPTRAATCLDSRQRELAVLVDVLADSDRDALREADTAVASLPPPEACSRATGEAPPIPERIRDAIARSTALRVLGEYERALSVADAAFREAGGRAGTPGLAEIESQRGLSLQLLGRYDDALRAFSASFFGARMQGRRSIGIMAGLHAATVAAAHLHDLEAGRQWLDHVETAFGDAIASDPVWGAALLDTRGRIALAEGDADAALEAFREAVDAVADAPQLDDGDRVVYLEHLAVAHFRRGDNEDARRTLERVLPMAEAYHGPDHLTVVQSRITLAAVLQRLRRAADAKRELQHALRSGEHSLPPEHPALALAWTNLGSVQLGSGELEDAEHSFGRALSISEASFDHRHPAVVRALASVAEVASLRGDFDHSLQLHRDALERIEAGGGDPIAEARSLGGISTLQWLTGNLDAAAATLEEVAARLENAEPPAELVRTILLVRCQLQLERDRVAEARGPCERAARLAEEAGLDGDDRARHDRAMLWYRLRAGQHRGPVEVPPVAAEDIIDRHVERAIKALAR